MRVRFCRFPAVAAALILAAASAAPAQSPRGTATGEIGGAEVTIDYGRPSLQGRDMLGQATDGMVWRLGADQATGITTSAALDIGGAMVPAGSYTLFARKSGDGWVLLVNSQTGQWGTERDEANDLFEIPLAVGEGEMTEQFTISVDADALRFVWGETVLTASVKGG